MKKLTTSELVMYILLFLFAANFINMESRLILIVAVSVFILTSPRFYLDFGFGAILIFSLVFYLISVYYHPEYLTYYLIPYLLAPGLGYLAGNKIYKINHTSQNINASIRSVTLIIVLGRFVHGILNLLVSGGYQTYNRNGIDVWTNSVLAATGQGALITLSISLLFYSVFVLKWREAKSSKLILVGSVILSIYNSIMTASRTALIVMVIVLIINIIYMIFSSDMGIKKKTGRLLIIAIVCVGSYVLFVNNVLGIYDKWESSPLYERMNLSTGYLEGDENRVNSIKETLTNAWDLPFGDGSLDTAHNLWLDVLKQVGWIPFLLLVIFTVFAIKQVVDIMCSKNVSKDNKFLIL